MRVIIAGSRNVTDYQTVVDAIGESGFPIALVLSGSAYGVDQLGERWAKENGKVLVAYPAQWSDYGKRAGPIRNQIMAQNADALIAIWDGKSSGTSHMIWTAERLGLKVYVKKVEV